MKSIRFYFFLVVLICVVLFFISFRDPQEEPLPTPSIAAENLIGVFGQGKIYKDDQRLEPYQRETFGFSDGRNRVFTDQETTLALFLSGHRLLLHENSGFDLWLQEGRCQLLSGRISWERVTPSPTHLVLGEEQQRLLLSQSGMVEHLGDRLSILPFSGQAVLSHGGRTTSLEALTRTELRGESLSEPRPLPPVVTMIEPEELTISQRDPKDVLVRFTWSTVPGVNLYRFRLMGSEGMAPVLVDRLVSSDRHYVDLLAFSDQTTFFWDVTPFDEGMMQYGAPSKMGRVVVRGRLLKARSALLPPSLEIGSLTVSGTMVLIEGVAQADSDLFIDDLPIKIDEDGKFVHSLKYEKVGQKTIVFRLISPAEIETVIERAVTLYVE